MDENIRLILQLRFRITDWAPKPKPGDPGPAEIRRLCEEIRSSWDEDVESDRRKWDGNRTRMVVSEVHDSCFFDDSITVGDPPRKVAAYSGQAVPNDDFGRRRGSEMPTARLTSKDVREIRRSSALIKDLAKKYGVSQATISKVRNRVTWRHVVDTGG